MAPCLGLPRGPFIQGGVGRCCPYLDWHRSPPHALPVLVTEGSNPQQSRHQSSRVAPAPPGRDTNAKTSPAPSAAVLITRSRRAEQASKKLQESPKVRAEPGGKKYIYIYICIQRTSVLLSLRALRSHACLCWAAQCGPRQGTDAPLLPELRGRRPLQPNPKTRSSLQTKINAALPANGDLRQGAGRNGQIRELQGSWVFGFFLKFCRPYPAT